MRQMDGITNNKLFSLIHRTFCSLLTEMKWLIVILLLVIAHVESTRPFSCGSFLNALVVGKANKADKKLTKKNKNKKISQKQALDDDGSDDSSFDGKSPILPGSSKFKLNLSLTQILSVAPIVAVLSSMLITMKVKVNDKSTQFKLRIIFGVYMAISQLLVMRIRSAINDAEDESIVTLPPAVNPLAMLTGQSPEAAASAPPVTKMAMEYDLDTLKSMSSGLLTEGAMALGMHFFINKSGQSLVYSVCSGIASLINNQLVQIHILGLPATGLLARPFRSQSDRMMAKMLAAQGTATAEGDVSSTVEVTEIEVNDAIAKSSPTPSETVTAVVEEAENNEEEEDDDEDDENDDEMPGKESTLSPKVTNTDVSASSISSSNSNKVVVKDEDEEEDGEEMESSEDESAISAAADELENALRDLAQPTSDTTGEGSNRVDEESEDEDEEDD